SRRDSSPPQADHGRSAARSAPEAQIAVPASTKAAAQARSRHRSHPPKAPAATACNRRTAPQAAQNQAHNPPHAPHSQPIDPPPPNPPPTTNVTQQQTQHVPHPPKRKQIRPHRPPAQKINPTLQARPQPPANPPFAHRPTQTPNARRFPSQNLLPRNPKPLRKDRAQALMALNNIPKRSFQRPNIQLATKPYRQRDHVAPARTLQPLQKPQPTLPIRQRHLARTLNH